MVPVPMTLPCTVQKYGTTVPTGAEAGTVNDALPWNG